MDSRTSYDPVERPLVAKPEGSSGGNSYDTQGYDQGDGWMKLVGEFMRGGKDRRRQLLAAAGNAAKDRETIDEDDRYEPQRLTRKIHWQYNRDMKKVPMLRRDYIA